MKKDKQSRAIVFMLPSLLPPFLNSGHPLLMRSNITESYGFVSVSTTMKAEGISYGTNTNNESTCTENVPSPLNILISWHTYEENPINWKKYH